MKKLYAVLLMIALAPASALAVPVQYTFTLGATDIDADGGTGSLYWDAVTHSLSNLTWNFGVGRTGGVVDAKAGWSDHPFSSSGTEAEFVFEVLSGENVFAPVACGTVSSCSAGFGGFQLFGWPGSNIYFSVTNVGTRSYDILVNGINHHGNLGTAAAATAVPEPSSWLLVTAGLATLALIRRRRASDSAR